MPPESEDYQQNSAKWRIDKHIPIAILAAMLVQTATIVWWAATLTSRVSYLELAVASDGKVSERLSVVETRLSDIQLSVQELAREHSRSH